MRWSQSLLFDIGWAMRFPGERVYGWKHDHGFEYEGEWIKRGVFFYADDWKLIGVGFYRNNEFVVLRENGERYISEDGYYRNWFNTNQ